MLRTILLIILFFSFSAQSQEIEHTSLLSYNLGKNIKNYKISSKQAYRHKKYKEAEALFDTLVKNVINGSHMDNFTARRLSGRKIDFHKYKKPVFLKTYASWCTPGVGEIPALNEVAKKYRKEIDFVVLYWDTKENAKKATKKYNSHVSVIYIDEAENKHCRVIRLLKHSVGFPSSFLIDQNKTVLNMTRGILHPYEEDYTVSFDLNYNSLTKGISVLLNSNESQYIMDSNKE